MIEPPDIPSFGDTDESNTDEGNTIVYIIIASFAIAAFCCCSCSCCFRYFNISRILFGRKRKREEDEDKEKEQEYEGEEKKMDDASTTEIYVDLDSIVPSPYSDRSGKVSHSYTFTHISLTSL